MSSLKVGWGLPAERVHTLYREILDLPPEGVQYVFPEGGASKGRPSLGARLRGRVLCSPAVRRLLDPMLVGQLDEGRPRGFGRLAASLRSSGVLGSSGSAWWRGFDLFHSNGNAMVENVPLIVKNDVRWVVDMEHAGSLFGYYGDWRKRIYDERARAVLRKQLSSRYCRKLLPWTDAARRTVEALLSFPEVAEKTEVLRLAIRPAPPRPADIEKHSAVRILFIGSVNHGGEFWSKGGMEVLESYHRLRQRYGEALELNFRCWMPDEMVSRYGSEPGLRRIPGFLPKDELDRLFFGSDILLFPAHNTPGMAILEGMRFGLPVVAKDIWANREQVQDGVTGFLVPPSSSVPYCLPGDVPNWSMDSGPFLEHMVRGDERVISDLVARLSELVESATLRARMGAEGRKAVEGGRLSVKVRNAALKRIYEEAAER